MDSPRAVSDVVPSLAVVLGDLARLRRDGAKRVRLVGCEGALEALVVAELAKKNAAGRPLVVVARDGDHAETLARDLEFFLPRKHDDDDPTAAPRVMLLPELETTPWAEVSPDRRATVRRMATLFRLSQGLVGDVLVTSASGLARRTMPREAFTALVDILQAEQEIDRDSTLRLLERAGYARAPVVEDPGTYAVRGGVIDVFVPLYRFPARIELFGDLVESIRFFDPSTQRTMRTIHELYIHPVRDTVVTAKAHVRERLLDAADKAEHPSAATRRILEQVESGEDFFGADALVPAMHARMASIVEYVPANATWFLDDPTAILATIDEEWARGEEAYEARVAAHKLAFPPSEFLLDEAAVEAAFAAARTVEAVPFDVAGDPAPAMRLDAETNAELSSELRRAMAEKHDELLRPLVRRVKEWQQDGGRTILVSPSVAHGERLSGLLRGYGLEPQLHKSANEDLHIVGQDAATATALRGKIEIVAGPLAHGFRLPSDAVWVVTESEIFGEKATRATTKKRAMPSTTDFKALEPGGFVVHQTHGVGVYRGLTKLPVGQIARGGASQANVDFLHLEYDGGALYLPVWRLNEVQRYVGAEGATAKIDKLGGQTWDKTRSKVSREVQKLAEDLLQIYAQRKALPGNSYALHGHDEQLFHEFEAQFPFEETVDQQRAIDDVLVDMDEARPMDRLVCGDVGYGKTEVAMRAAMKAVLAGKQVAVLAPTTVLVEQHANSFAERMKDYPVKVDSLSRFKSRQEQIEVIKGLAENKIDVVVGTHRLLSTDVRFKDLGLLIIDEEHRFGVSHKERIKALKTQLDCLTMSATPIPRTLHMALMGLREISIITTPPADRLAVRTLVARPDDAILVEGMKRELARGGQIFFVHNRVEDIHKWSAKLRELMPELKIVVGHGQMPAEELERVMCEFVDGRADVLLCTTIIESGLDIPRANTMFVNRADCFGLAQLYQLRGRIGRSKVRAYCYLLVPPEASLTSDAKQRLAVLQKFTELGAGFQIASHDLEIRGSGDVLGARQSGNIAAVGFEMYTQLLEEAVAALKGETIQRERDPDLTCDLPGFIPDDYLPDTAQRLDFYKRFSTARDEGEVAGLVEELTDRYGAPPDEVSILADIMIVKGLGRRLEATALELTEQRLALALDERTPLKPAQVMKLVNAKGTLWRLTPDMRLMRSFAPAERNDRIMLAKKLLSDLLVAASAA